MSEIDYTRVLELLASKICHDLISPVGAVANGIEIMEEIGPDAGEDVTSLISYSSAQASAKLKLLRLAYGLGGSEESIKLEDVHEIFGDFLAGEGRIIQDWNPYLDHNLEMKKGSAKLLLCSLIMASENMPKGGTISVEADGDGLCVKAEGENTHFKEGQLDSLNHKIDCSALAPKLIHAYVTGMLLSSYKFEICTEEPENGIILLRLTSSAVS